MVAVVQTAKLLSSTMTQRTSVITSDIWALLDGRLNAPAGPAQYPTILNGYAPATGRVRTGLTVIASQALGNAQPPWQVAGVDYRVGPPSGQTFIDPSVSPPAGTSFSVTGLGGLLTVNSPNTIIDGYDFTLYNSGEGCSFVCSQANCQLLRSKFNAARTNQSTGGAYVIVVGGGGIGFTMKYCTMDGGAQSAVSPNQSSLIKVAGSVSSTVFQYNQWINYIQHILEYVDSTGNLDFGAIDLRFNIFDDSPSFPGQHYNWLQFGPGVAGPVTTSTNLTIKFNLSRQVSLGGAEGWQPAASVNQDIFVNNNCMISLPNGGSNTLSEFMHVNDNNTSNIINGSATISENYCDCRGLLSYINSGGGSGAGTHNINHDMPPVNYTYSNIVDMPTGRFILSNGALL